MVVKEQGVQGGKWHHERKGQDGELVFFLVVLPNRFSNPAPENLREANLTSPLPPRTEGRALSPQLAEPQTPGCWLPSIEGSGLGGPIPGAFPCVPAHTLVC